MLRAQVEIMRIIKFNISDLKPQGHARLVGFCEHRCSTKRRCFRCLKMTSSCFIIYQANFHLDGYINKQELLLLGPCQPLTTSLMGSPFR